MLSVIILSAYLITATADTEKNDYTYVIQPHKDTFAVYESKAKAPIYIFENQKLTDLPDADQKSIRQGLEISDKNELEQRIEDFES